MDVPILTLALIGMGTYCHTLLSKIADLMQQNLSLTDMIKSMARELKSLGSPNVAIFEESPTP
jgi:hypothetical protein